LIGGNDDYIQKLLDDPNVPDRTKVKLQMRQQQMNESERRTDLMESGQEWNRYLGAQNLGIARQNQEDNLAGNTQERALKGLTLEQAMEVRDLQRQIGAETDPVKQRALMDRYDALTGDTGKYTVTSYEVPVDPANPLAGTIKKAVRINTKTGVPEDLADLMNGGQPKPTGKRDAQGRMIYQDANGNLLVDDGQ